MYYAFEDDLNLLGNVKGKKVIELGCGGAQISIALAKKGAICTGIDLSKEQLKFAKNLAEKNKIKIELIEGDFENLETIKNNSFDIAISTFAFDWAKNLEEVFKEAFRILKDNGIFVFSMQHPVYILLGDNPKELKVSMNYFERKDIVKESTGITIEYYNPTISDIINGLIKSGFILEKTVEPEPEEKKIEHYFDEWYPIEVLKKVPATIIFKARKKKI